jgi:hypothetical protein
LNLTVSDAKHSSRIAQFVALFPVSNRQGNGLRLISLKEGSSGVR